MRKYLFLLLSIWWLNGSFLTSQEQLGVGILPLDWSGQWGIYHRYGFPGWEEDHFVGSLMLDGTFIDWPARYSFPFLDNLKWDENVNSETDIWYRRGDYALDEFALNLKFKQGKDEFIQFQGMKRNFEGENFYFGPLNSPGGTIQQNYKLTYHLLNDEQTGWDIELAYFKTIHSIPGVKVENVIYDRSIPTWVKSVSQKDHVFTTGITRLSRRGKFRASTNFGLFSERLRLLSNSDLPSWQGDLVTYWVIHRGQLPLSSQFDLITNFSTKRSFLDSDSLGYQEKKEGNLSIGFNYETEGSSSLGKVGLGFVADEWQWTGRISVSGKNEKLKMFFDLAREFVTLSYQMKGIHFRSYPLDVMTYNRAQSQVRSRILVEIHKIWKKGVMTLGTFYSMMSPHYYFQNNFLFIGDKQISLVKKEKSMIQGFLGKFQWNYFRNWWLSGEGISFLHNENGWGNGFQHQGEISLTFQEYFYQRNLDTRLRVWTSIWLSRDSSFVWDPFIFIGYYNRFKNELPSNQGVLNIEIKGIVSSKFEISYTMLNLFYILEKWSGRKIGKGETAFTATSTFPPLGRLTYLTIQWNFSN